MTSNSLIVYNLNAGCNSPLALDNSASFRRRDLRRLLLRLYAKRNATIAVVVKARIVHTEISMIVYSLCVGFGALHSDSCPMAHRNE